jgi:hypothetical protein
MAEEVAKYVQYSDGGREPGNINIATAHSQLEMALEESERLATRLALSAAPA